MKPVPVPDGVEYQALPTFDDLRSGSGFKVAQLRARLVSVPCWKCPDNTVRYDSEASAAAMADGVQDDEEPDGDDKPPSLLFLFNKMLAILASQQKAANETIRIMGEPLRAGVELWATQGARSDKRLGQLEENWDRMVQLIEKSLTAQNDRDIALKRHDATQQFRQQTFTLAKEQLPTIIEKWTLTSEAAMAMKLVRSIDPALVDVILDSGTLDEEQTAILRKFRATMQPKAAAEPAAEEPTSHDN